MTPQIGKKYLITTDGWFYAPDGECYRAVFGTVSGIGSDKDTLGIQTNRHSTNWYVAIGNMIVAGCQIHYCIKTNDVSDKPPTREIEHNGNLHTCDQPHSRIYHAD